MRRRKSVSIGELLQQVLREEGLETPLMQQRLLAAWPEVAGQRLAQYTDRLFIKNQTLMIHVRSSVCRQELLLRKADLIIRLNQAAEGQVIVDIGLY